MPIKQLTPFREIESYFEREVARRENALQRTLTYIGEACVRAARSTDSYKDRTGNLRSSTGYVLVKNGRVIQASGFKQESAKRPLEADEKADGGKSGKAFAKELAAKHPTGFALIIVAGMNYASKVAATGRDVLDSAELEADRLVAELVRELRL
jgi:hypothetical protein